MARQSAKKRRYELQLMRNYIKEKYPGKGFCYEVDNTMSDRQVRAIYLSIKEREDKPKKTNDEGGRWIQMSIADILPKKQTL